MKLALLGIILLTLSQTVSASSPETNCFAHHIHESIVINTARKHFYSRLTKGHSDEVYNLLILTERLSLPMALVYDLRASGFQKKGVPVFCREFVSINATSTFDPSNIKIPTDKFVPFNYGPVKAQLKKAIAVGDMDAVKRLSLDAVVELNKTPSYHCMVKHIFESVYRFAYFLPKQVEAARNAGLKSPSPLLIDGIKLHLLALLGSAQIDKKSAPIQAQGIPVLCAELPHLLDGLE